ncbi:MAG: glycosyltransferase family 4 protein [Desulfobacterales bacterium]|nr:glycosyltransferase family 4 protein [Desulfobacterales bacterium]MBF0397814.1 glycosyltransferase family 4 protein [Desulfobacterales bacterium]
MSKPTRFFYLIPALSKKRFSYESRWTHIKRVLFGGKRQVPSGGVKIIYQHCDLLNKNGIQAFPVHLGDFVIDWFAHQSNSITTDKAISLINENDVVICPEVIPRAADIFKCRRKIAFVQNWFLTEIAMKQDKSYEDFGFYGILACSNYIKEYMSTRSRLECKVVTNGIDLNLFRPAPEKRINMRVLCFNRRNIDNFRDARKLLPDILNKSAEFIELENKYSQNQVIEFYQSSDIFAAIGYPEGFALPPIEAMACGCSVIGFTGGGAKEFMIDKETALVSPDGNVKSFAQNLEIVLTDNEIKEKIRVAGINKSKEYSLKRMEHELLAFADSF